MQPCQVVVENILFLLLWLANVIGDCFMFIILILYGRKEGWVMAGALGVMHFLLNAWILRFSWKSMNKCGLVFLFLTQTAPLYMLCRRAWRSLVSCCAKDDRTRKRKALIAKFSLCFETLNSSEKYVAENFAIPEHSCVPTEYAVESNHCPAVSPSSDMNIENGDYFIDHYFSQEGQESQVIPMENTKFEGDTSNIVLNFNAPQEIHAGEQNILKYVKEVLQLLFLDEKMLSYHIITDSKSKILYISKSDRQVRKLTSTVCSDIHYILNLAKGTQYEVFAITKRTFEVGNIFINTDLSKLIWSLVWPSTVIKLFAILDLIGEDKRTYDFMSYCLIVPIISIVTWLLTQRGVADPWRNTAILIPIRILITVPRTLLVIGIGITTISMAAFCYISVKAIGIFAFSTYIIYVKKHKNVELFRDAIDRYTFIPNFNFVIQVSESIVYFLWALWWYSTFTSKGSFGDLKRLHLPLIFLLMTLLGQIFGLTWLWFLKPYRKQPLKNPASVLRLVHALEYTRT